MTKKKKKTFVVVEPAEEEEDSIPFYEGPSAVQKALAGLPQNEDCIQLSRLPASGRGRPAYIARLMPVEFDIEYIKTKWGGGRFKFEGIEDSEVTRAGIFEIEGRPIIEGEREEEEVKLEAERKAAASNSLGNPMLEELRQLRADMARAKESEVISLLRDLIKSKQEVPVQSQSFLDTTAILGFTREVVALAGAGEGGGSIWPLVLDKVSPLLTQIGNVIARIAPPQGLVRQPRARDIGQVDPDHPQINSPTGFQVLAPNLKLFLPSFMMAASIGKDPQEMVDLVINNISEENKPVVIEWLKNSAWFTELVTLDPGLQLQQAWWTDLHDLLLEILTGVAMDRAVEGEEEEGDK